MIGFNIAFNKLVIRFKEYYDVINSLVWNIFVGESNSESGDVSSEKEHLVDKRLIECQDSPDQESIEPENMTAEDSQPVLEVDSDEYEQLVSNGSEIEEMMTAEDMEKRIVQEQ